MQNLKRNQQTGSVLICALIIIALSTQIVFLIATQSQLQLSFSSAYKNYIQELIDLNSDFTKELRKVDLGTIPSALKKLDPGTELYLLNQHLVIKKATDDLFKTPNWHRLENYLQRRGTTQSCSVLSNHNPDCKFCSKFTCREEGLNLEQDTYFKGNLQTSNLSIAGTIKLVINGELQLENLDLTQALSVEIIVLGEIKIGSIKVNPNPQQILIHSALGKITVTNFSDDLLACSEQVKFRLEANQGQVLNGTNFKQRQLGCEITKDAKFWPNLQVIGVLSD
ncbi:hypothetical protein JNK13_06210 [bacterium]|nr:hypothetical protein [bacterium]